MARASAHKRGFNLRIEKSLYDSLKAMAATRGCSLNEELAGRLEKSLDYQGAADYLRQFVIEMDDKTLQGNKRQQLAVMCSVDDEMEERHPGWLGAVPPASDDDQSTLQYLEAVHCHSDPAKSLVDQWYADSNSSAWEFNGPIPGNMAECVTRWFIENGLIGDAQEKAHRERAAIAAWLRDISPDKSASAIRHALADAIERGDHHGGAHG